MRRRGWWRRRGSGKQFGHQFFFFFRPVRPSRVSSFGFVALTLSRPLSGCPSLFKKKKKKNSLSPSLICSITKLYIRNACLSLRDNNLGLQSYKELTCDAARDAGSATCAAAFAQAPKDSVLSAKSILSSGVASSDANASGGKIFDSGDVCGNSDSGFVYVLNMCDEPVRVTVEVRSSAKYRGRMPCVKVLGKQLGAVAILVSVLAAVVGLGLLAGLCCCCVRCCCR